MCWKNTEACVVCGVTQEDSWPFPSFLPWDRPGSLNGVKGRAFPVTGRKENTTTKRRLKMPHISKAGATAEQETMTTS